jgi:hypothetical protein
MAFLALFFRESRKQMCLQPYSGVYSIETSMLAEDGGGDLCQLRRWWLWSAAALLLLSAAVLYVSRKMMRFIVQKALYSLISLRNRNNRARPWPKVRAEVCTFRPRRAQAPAGEIARSLPDFATLIES